MTANKKRKNLVKNLSVALLGKLSKTPGGIFIIDDGKEQINVEASFRKMLEYSVDDTVRINLRVNTAQHYDIYEYSGDVSGDVEDETD